MAIEHRKNGQRSVASALVDFWRVDLAIRSGSDAASMARGIWRLLEPHLEDIVGKHLDRSMIFAPVLAETLRACSELARTIDSPGPHDSGPPPGPFCAPHSGASVGMRL